MGGRMKNLLFILLVFLVGENLACKSEVSKEAVYKIDDLLSKRMTLVIKKIEEDKNLATKDKYNKDYTDEVERSSVHLEYLQEKIEIMSAVKKEIDEGNEELVLLLEKYPQGKPGHTLIFAFKNYFDAYKTFMDSLDKDLKNQIKTCILYNSIVSLETNQQLFFDALDSFDIKQAQFCYEKEGELINNYDSNFKLVDFKGKIPSEWATKFRNTYDKMHEWNKKFLEARKQKDDSLYRKLRLEGFELVFKIPYAKSEKFRTEIENVLFGYDPEIEKLEKKSAEAGREAYQMYYVRKTKIGEDPYAIWRKKQ